MKSNGWIRVGWILLHAAPLAAELAPQGSVVDSRVRTVAYSDNQVYKIIAYYGYQTDIELAANEEIRTVAAGDTVGWQIVTAGQHIFIKPMADHARTNLSVVTSRRTYVFDLVGQSVSDRWDMTYLVRFKYPQPGTVLAIPSGRGGVHASADFNFNYKVKGDKDVRPSRVFDDGEFTFFQFDAPRDGDLPAIFYLTPDGHESLVNYRMEGNYMVVERLGMEFILRSGDGKATVRNKQPVPAAR